MTDSEVDMSLLVETRYEHVILNEAEVPIIAGTTMKVVELVLEKMAYGWSPEELHLIETSSGGLSLWTGCRMR